MREINKIEFYLVREEYGEKQTLGELEVYENGELVFSCKTLELAWRDNKIKESCIPEGGYPIRTRHSQKYGNHILLEETAPRSFILFHSGNYYTQLEGCILPGLAHLDINGDGLPDVTNSRATLAKLVAYLANNGGRGYLTITSRKSLEIKHEQPREEEPARFECPSVNPFTPAALGGLVAFIICLLMRAMA